MPLRVGLAISKAHTVSVNSSEGKGFPNGDVIVLKGKVSGSQELRYTRKSHRMHNNPQARARDFSGRNMERWLPQLE